MTRAEPGEAQGRVLPDGVSDTLPADVIEVGRVLGAWGIKGGIRIKPFAKDPKALLAAQHWVIRPPDGFGARLGVLSFPPLLRITHSKEHGDGVVATAQELPDRNAAEAMQGARVFVARSHFPKVGDGEFYWIDLIGLAVVNREGEALGTVSDLLDTGAHSVLRVRRPDAAEGATLDASERLIPFVAAFVDTVSLAERRITVDWGLDF